MSILEPHRPVKLFFSLFGRNRDILDAVRVKLAERYGETDFDTGYVLFDQTDYYVKEFGSGLSRVIIAMKKLIAPEDIVGIKLAAAEVEESLKKDGRRTINIDPGYLTLARVVLTTGKDFAHRIYIGSGVFADLTLMYWKGEGFMPLPWTYPDYASGEYRGWFNRMRELLRKGQKEETA